MKRHILSLFLTTFVAAPVFAEDKHEHKDGTKHEKHDEKESTEVEIKFEELPAKVSESFKKHFPEAKVEEVKKETYKDGQIHYEIEFKDKDGKEHEIEFNADGEKLEEHDDHAK